MKLENIQYMNTDELIPYVNNTKIHDAKQVKSLTIYKL